MTAGRGRAVARQLEEELEAALVMPASALLGPDLGDLLRDRLPSACQVLAAQLCGDDPSLAAETTIDVMGVLWPAGVTDHDWWRTPLGRECARSFDASDAVTQREAADILGVTRGTIAQLVHRGDLARSTDGGVMLASVLERMLRLS